MRKFADIFLTMIVQQAMHCCWSVLFLQYLYAITWFISQLCHLT